MGLLNGLSKTLGARTNLLVEMARLMDRPTNGADGAQSRSLLEA
jgi:hypothetical protein